MRRFFVALTIASALSVFVAFVTVCRAEATTAVPAVYRVDHVVDGDTIALRNGQRVRLVQIDTPRVLPR
jgi:endonuclease YncB( thermonuclease family)